MVIANGEKAIEVKELTEHNIIDAVFLISSPIEMTHEKRVKFLLKHTKEFDRFRDAFHLSGEITYENCKKLFIPPIGYIEIVLVQTPEEVREELIKQKKRQREFFGGEDLKL